MSTSSAVSWPVSAEVREAFGVPLAVDLADARRRRRLSLERRDDYWALQAERLTWDAPFTRVVRESPDGAEVAWFEGGQLNACRHALDLRVSAGRGDVTALVAWEPDGRVARWSYRELLARVERLAVALEGRGLARGDRLAVYAPDAPEVVLVHLAAARLGLVMVPLSWRYPARLVSDCLADAGATALVVAGGGGEADYALRRDAVLAASPGLLGVALGGAPPPGLVAFDALLAEVPEGARREPVPVSAEHPLFLRYARAAGGPRGVVFATGGFVVQAAATHALLLEAACPGGPLPSVHCCLDLDTLPALAHGLWGALASGTTLSLRPGHQPDARVLAGIAAGPDEIGLLTGPGHLLALREVLGGATLGERRFSFVACTGDPLPPRLIRFAGAALTRGDERVLNLWLQTETGGALLATGPSLALNRPGALGLPLPGIEALVANDLGEACRPNESGRLLFRGSWPARARAVWNQPGRLAADHFGLLPGCFATHDGVRVDPEGFLWFMGRLDDVVRVRGQSIATSEVEHALTAHPRVAEAAVVGVGGDDAPLAAFVVLREPLEPGEEGPLAADLEAFAVGRLGDAGRGLHVVFAPGLPRTRSGKVVRRVLKRIASGDLQHGEDWSHVANPDSLEALLRSGAAPTDPEEVRHG